jgi:hypothetical protein
MIAGLHELEGSWWQPPDQKSCEERCPALTDISRIIVPVLVPENDARHASLKNPKLPTRSKAKLKVSAAGLLGLHTSEL